MKLPFKPFDKDAFFEQTRRRLPHREQPGCTYFVTWRLADSVPLEMLEQWRAERVVFLTQHPKPWDEAMHREYDQRFERRLERWADEGHGSCHLQVPELRQALTTALHFFEGDRYDLDDFVVMPNHVHVLVRPYAGTEAEDPESRQECLQHTPPKLNPASLAGVMKNWKGFTSREINLRLNRRGTLWMDESFDHAVRSEAQLKRFREYMRENPVTAHLKTGAFEHWQSADV